MKKSIVLATVLAFLVFFVAEPALAQYGGGMMGGGRGKASDMMEYGKGIRAGQGMYGMGFMPSAGNIYGNYVTFTIDNQTGNVLNYGIAGTTLFNISIANFNYKSNSTSGSLTRVSNADGSIMILINDNPAAVINIRTSKSISVTFTLADNVTATKENNMVRIKSGNVAGIIVGIGAITSSVSGRQVKIDIPANNGVLFRSSPVNMPMFNDLDQKISRQIEMNRMGMEIALGRDRTTSSIDYTSGKMNTVIQEMQQNRIKLLVSATEPSGRIIVINLDNTSLAIGARERLRIRYDDQYLDCVNDPDAVLGGTDRPVCWISPAQDGVRMQMLLYIPKFSEHTIDIVVEAEVTATVSPTSTPTTQPTATAKAPGFGLLVSLAGLLSCGFLLRRRNK